jgi:two-component system chemotaxis response regulator CheY
MGAAESIESQNGNGLETATVSLLLIEDVSVTADIERSYFGSVGFNVLSGGTVVEAEAQVSNNWVDIVIIDAAFARKRGIELIPVLKKASQNKQVKVIVTSVSGEISIKKAATAAGASAFIVKPAPRPRYLKEIKKLSSQKARDTERIHKTLAVTMVIAGSERKAETLDLSSEGIHIAVVPATGDYALGGKLWLTFEVEGKEIKIMGEVVRHTPKGIGVRFLEMGVQARRLLDKFLLRYSIEHQASHFYL